MAAVVLLLLLVLLFCWSYRSGNLPLELKRVDSLSGERPDAALTALARCDTTKAGSAARAYYKYLQLKIGCKQQAGYKMSPQRLTKIIADFERVHPSDASLADLYYYSGCVYRNLNDYPQAQSYFLKALALYEKTGEKDQLGKCHFQIGHILRCQCLYSEALKHFARSEAFCREAGDQFWQCFALRDLAWCYHAVDKLSLADKTYGKALRIARQNKNREMEAYLCGQRAGLLIDMRRYREAEQSLANALEYNDPQERSPNLCILVRLYNTTGREKEAIRYCHELMRVGTIYGKQNASCILAKYYLKTGNAAEAVKYAALNMEANDSVRSLEAVLATSQMNAAYNYKKYVQHEQQLREEKMTQQVTIVAISAAFVLVIIVFWLTLRRINKKKREQMLKYAGVVVALRETEEDRQRLAHQLEERETLRNSMTLQNGLQDEKLDRIKRAEVYRKFKAVAADSVGGGEVTADDWRELEDLLYGEFPNLQNVLLSIQNLSEQNRNMCLLIKAGFKPIELSRVLCREKSTINSARGRLYERVFGEKGKPSLWDEFIRNV